MVGAGRDLLLDLEVLVGGVLVAVDLHVGYVSLFRSGSHGAGLFHLEDSDNFVRYYGLGLKGLKRDLNLKDSSVIIYF